MGLVKSIKSIGLVFIFFLNCQKPTPKTNSEILPSQIVEEFKLTESQGGKKIYQLTAKKAYQYEALNKIEVLEPKIVFFNETGEESSILVARLGRVFTKTSDLVAQKEVVVKTADSTYLYTDSLVWLNLNQLVTTDCWIKIKSPEGIIEGQGLIADAGLKKIEVKSAIKGKSNYRFTDEAKEQ